MMLVKHLGQVAYAPTEQAMRAFTRARDSQTPDELWLCEHPPTLTLGLAGQEAHIINAGNLPIIQTDRGGQVTYHGLGQIVAYPLLNLQRRGYFVKEYVYKLEEAVIRTLAHFGVTGHRVRSAPGVYVRLDDPHSHAVLAAPANPSELVAFFQRERLGKIAALGIKLSRHYTYHGVALNVAMDLEPFTRIHPCGYTGLKTVDLATLEVRSLEGEKSITAAEVLPIFEVQLQRWLTAD